MLPNHSYFTAIEEDQFLVGTRVHAALEQMMSQYLKKEFRSSARRFLEELTSTVLSTCRTFQAGSGRQLFLPGDYNRG